MTGPAADLPQGLDPNDLPIEFLRGLDPEQVASVPLRPDEQAELLSARARCLRELGREDEADQLEVEAAGLEDER